MEDGHQLKKNVVKHIKKIYPEYVYNQTDFRIIMGELGLEISDWALTLDKPNLEDISDCCEKDCVCDECTVCMREIKGPISKLQELEDRIKALEKEVKMWESV